MTKEFADPTVDMRMIQDIYKDEPWMMLVGCMMLNQTNNKQVRPVIKKFFKKYTTPQEVIDADENDMINMMRSLGFYNRRTKSIKNFCYDWLYKDWNDITELRGIGKYASDSYEIFINGNLNVEPTDKVLLIYLDDSKLD